MMIVSWSGPWSGWSMPALPWAHDSFMLKLDERGIWIGRIIS